MTWRVRHRLPALFEDDSLLLPRERSRIPRPTSSVQESPRIPEACHVLSHVVDSATGLDSFVGLLSLDGTLYGANHMAAEANLPSVDATVGSPFWQASWWSWTPAAQHRVREAVTSAAAGSVLRYREQAMGTQGRLLTVHLALVPVIVEGVITALIASVVGIAPDSVDPEQMSPEQMSPDQAVALATFIRRLAAGTDVQDVVRAVAESGPQVVNALQCRLVLWDSHRDLLVAPDWRHRPRAQVAGSPGPEAGLVTVRPPAPTVTSTPDAPRHPDGDVRRHLERRVAIAEFTLFDPPGDIYAALDLVWSRSPHLGRADVACLNMMAELTGTALRRALDPEVREDRTLDLRCASHPSARCSQESP